MLTSLEDVSLSLNLLKIFVQNRATLMAQQCCMMLASFEQALKTLYIILQQRNTVTTLRWRLLFNFYITGQFSLRTCQFRKTIQFIRHISYGSLQGNEVRLSTVHFNSICSLAEPMNKTF